MLGIGAKLMKLLSEDNILYLDILLRALTQPEGSPIYDVLWSWFERAFPDNPNARQHAWRALRQLHQIVLEYRTKRGI